MELTDLHTNTQVMPALLFLIHHEIAVHQQFNHLKLHDLLTELEVLFGDWGADFVVELVCGDEVLSWTHAL